MSLLLSSRHRPWTSGGMKKHRPKAMPSRRWKERMFAVRVAAVSIGRKTSGEMRTCTELLAERERVRELNQMDAP